MMKQRNSNLVEVMVLYITWSIRIYSNVDLWPIFFFFSF